MSFSKVNIGAVPNDGTGDTARDAFEKVNGNFIDAQAQLDGKATAAQGAKADTAVQPYGAATDIATTNVPASVSAFRTNGYYEAGDPGKASYHEGVETFGAIQSADGRWWELDRSDYPVFVFGARCDGSTDDYAAVQAAIDWSAAAGCRVTQPVGISMASQEFVFPSGADWHAPFPEICIVKKTADHMGRMLVTENWDTQKGNNDPDLPGLVRHVRIWDVCFDGNWMNEDKTAYVNDAGGGGLFIYSAKQTFVKVRILNMCGIGVYFDAPSGATTEIGFGRSAEIDVFVDTTKEENVIFNGVADRVGHRFYTLNSGARIASETADPLVPGPRSSPTYGATNGGRTDGIILLRGGERFFIHTIGHLSGLGYRVLGGRHNECFYMAETCRYGGAAIEAGYGLKTAFEAHRTGGGGPGGTDTTPQIFFNAPTENSLNYSDCLIGAYHANTIVLTPRPNIVFGSQGSSFKGTVYSRGGTVPGHGVVFENNSNFHDIYVDARDHLGIAEDGLASSAIYRKTQSSTSRDFKICGKVANSAVGFRAVSAVRKELIDLDMRLVAGQIPFVGDPPTQTGQDWNIRADVNGTPKRSKANGTSDAFASNITTEQTITIPHGLIAAPRFGRAHLTSLYDTPTTIGGSAALQYAVITGSDDTNITAKVKFSTANAVDTAPRIGWMAEV